MPETTGYQDMSTPEGAGPNPSIDELTDRFRQNQKTPRPGLFTGRSAKQIGLFGCLGLILACVALSIVYVVVSITAPLLVIAAVVLLVLAFTRPNLVIGIMGRWPFRLLPTVITAGPVRFAMILACVLIPISGIAGAIFYAGVLSDSNNGDPTPISTTVAVASSLTQTETTAAATNATATKALAAAVAPTPKPTPTHAPTATPTKAPTVTPTPKPSPTPTPIRTPTPTPFVPTPSPAPPIPTPTPVPQPTPTPSAPTQIAGLAAADVTINLKDKGFKCTGPTINKFATWECDFMPDSGAFEYHVEVMGRTPTNIFSVDCTVLNFSTLSTEEIAGEFLGYMATLPYKDSDPTTARQWVDDHLVDGGKMTIGTAQFYLYGSGANRILEMTAPGMT